MINIKKENHILSHHSQTAEKLKSGNYIGGKERTKKQKQLSTKILYAEKLFFKNECELKIVDSQQLRDILMRPVLQDIEKEVIMSEGN